MTLLTFVGVGGLFPSFLIFIGAVRSEFFLFFSSSSSVSSLNVTLQVWYRPCGSLVVTGSVSQV